MAKKRPSIKVPPRSNPYKGMVRSGGKTHILGRTVNPANPLAGFTQSKGRLYKSKRTPSQLKAASKARHGGGATPVKATPPPAPVTPPADTPPSPYDSLNTAEVAGIDRSTADSVAGIQGQQRALNTEYGIGDTSNPFNKMNLLKRHFEQARAGATNSAGNQLYAGSLQNAQTANQYNFDQSGNALTADYNRQTAAFTQGITDLNNQANERRNQANLDSLGRTLSGGPDEGSGTFDTGGGGGGGGGGGLSSAEYSRRLAVLRKKYGPGSAQVQAYRKRQGH